MEIIKQYDDTHRSIFTQITYDMYFDDYQKLINGEWETVRSGYILQHTFDLFMNY